MKLVFADQAREDYLHWQATDPATSERLDEGVPARTVQGPWEARTPEGRSEGVAARRINLEDRLVYRVAGSGDEQRLEIAQCRYHHGG